MPKYLIQASYTAEGIQGVVRDSASGRRADVQSAVKSAGGKVEAFYYSFGKDDLTVGGGYDVPFVGRDNTFRVTKEMAHKKGQG